MNRKPTLKEYNEIRRYIKDIEKAANFIEENFNNKTYLYKSNNYHFNLRIMKNNLMHLCGIEYKDGAKAFFENALDRKIVLSKINIKTDDTTMLKLAVISEFDKIISHSLLICPANAHGEVRYQFAIRTAKKILLIALNEEKKHSGNYIPVSLINLQTVQMDPKGEKVVSISYIDHILKKAITII